MKIAVIGSSGQLGAELVEEISLLESIDAHELDRSSVDCSSKESVENALLPIRPDVVINCAAYVHVDSCEDNRDLAFGVNSVGAFNVAAVCAGMDAECVYISTDYVFDGAMQRPYTEDDIPIPLNVYGMSKLCGESFVRGSCEKHYIIRSSGLYGKAGINGGKGNFVETMIRLAKNGEPIRVVNDQILTPTYTKDLAKKILELIDTHEYGLYHITNQGQCSWYEFGKRVFDVLKLNPDYKPITSGEYGSSARRPAYSVLANRGIKRLDIRQPTCWEDALGNYLSEW